jgi:predicted alpha/beta-hydrolase family hydrolase
VTKVEALLLFPGAGSDRNQRSLVLLEETLAPLPVARADFYYRREGRRAPDRPPKLIAAVREEHAALVERTGVDPANVVLGGRSMGGRICSMVVADGLPAAGLVLIAYPLHPPGRPETLRVEHLPGIEVPCLFISGTRDTFGTAEELEAHTKAIPGPVTHVWVDKVGHELRNADQRIADTVKDWLESL